MSQLGGEGGYAGLFRVINGHIIQKECQTNQEISLRFLRPARLTQRHLFASVPATSIHLTLPSVVLAKTGLRIAGVVEVDLGDLRLDKCPNAPD
jgi:hypothetical protein